MYFNIYIPPPYQRHIWHYNRSNTEEIRNAITHSIGQMPLVKILKNYIPNEVITIDEKGPPWMNTYIKDKIIYS